MARSIVKRLEPGVPPGEGLMRSNLVARAIVAAVITVVLGPVLLYVVGSRAWPAMVATGLLTFVNLGWLALYRRRIGSAYTITLLSLVVDAAMAVFLLHYFGGLQSGLVFILAWVPVSAGLLLGPRAIVVQTAAVVGMYATALALELTHVITPVVPLGATGMRVTGVVAGLVIVPLIAASTMMHVQTLHRLLSQERDISARLADLDRQRNQFVAEVTHDLRHPLTAIEGFGRTLAERWDSFPAEERTRLLTRIAENAETLDRMIVHLLEVARIDKEGLTLLPVPVPVEPKLTQIVARLQPVLRHHTVRVSVEPGLVLMADDYGLERILENLLSNAVKYSERGTTIRVAAASKGGNVTIRVADEGVGVPPEDRERIFDRFYRAAPSPHGNKLGIGIGLAVAREYVERQGGRIWVESEPQRGSIFAFTLPSAATRDLPMFVEAPAREQEAQL